MAGRGAPCVVSDPFAIVMSSDISPIGVLAPIWIDRGAQCCRRSRSGSWSEKRRPSPISAQRRTEGHDIPDDIERTRVMYIGGGLVGVLVLVLVVVLVLRVL